MSRANSQTRRITPVAPPSTVTTRRHLSRFSRLDSWSSIWCSPLDRDSAKRFGTVVDSARVDALSSLSRSTDGSRPARASMRPPEAPSPGATSHNCSKWSRCGTSRHSTAPPFVPARTGEAAEPTGSGARSTGESGMSTATKIEWTEVTWNPTTRGNRIRVASSAASTIGYSHRRQRGHRQPEPAARRRLPCDPRHVTDPSLAGLVEDDPPAHSPDLIKFGGCIDLTLPDDGTSCAVMSECMAGA